MLDFFKKLLGLPTKAEVDAAKQKAEAAPYKVEAPVINNKTGDVVDQVVITQSVAEVVAPVTTPAKKTRKPRTKKSEAKVVEKTAKASKKTAKNKSRKIKQS